MGAATDAATQGFATWMARVARSNSRSRATDAQRLVLRVGGQRDGEGSIVAAEDSRLQIAEVDPGNAAGERRASVQRRIVGAVFQLVEPRRVEDSARVLLKGGRFDARVGKPSGDPGIPTARVDHDLGVDVEAAVHGLDRDARSPTFVAVRSGVESAHIALNEREGIATERVEHVAAQQELEHDATAGKERDGVVARHELGTFEGVPGHVLEGQNLRSGAHQDIEEAGKIAAQGVHQRREQDVAVADLPGAVASPLLEGLEMIVGHGGRVPLDAGDGQPSVAERQRGGEARNGAADHHDIVTAPRRGSARLRTHGSFHC